MGYFRFHRSMRLMPGVRVNMSKSGPSLSVGPAGARMNIGPQGLRTTVGVPGTGMSYINRRSWGAKAKANTAKAPVTAVRPASATHSEKTKALLFESARESAMNMTAAELRREVEEIDMKWRAGLGDAPEEDYLTGRQIVLDALEWRKANPTAPFKRIEGTPLAAEIAVSRAADEKTWRDARNAERAAKWRPFLKLIGVWGLGFLALCVLVHLISAALGYSPL